MQALTGALSGLLFGVGLVLSGMTQPSKVMGFLDVAGGWDPSLAFVMLGAIAVYAPAYRFITQRSVPLYAQRFVSLVKSRLDAPLVLGAALFGVGWGLAGYCPGPAIVSLGSGAPRALVFGLGMLLGMGLFELYRRRATAVS